MDAGETTDYLLPGEASLGGLGGPLPYPYPSNTSPQVYAPGAGDWTDVLTRGINVVASTYLASEAMRRGVGSGTQQGAGQVPGALPRVPGRGVPTRVDAPGVPSWVPLLLIGGAVLFVLVRR